MTFSILRPMFDTGVFLRFLGAYPHEPKSKPCVDLGKEVLLSGGKILVAAPTLAEVLRGKKGPPVPKTPKIEVIPFDDIAAEFIGEKLDIDIIREAKAASGYTTTYLKYDALIAACAHRGKASHFITLDSDYGVFVKFLGLPVLTPLQALDGGQQQLKFE